MTISIERGKVALKSKMRRLRAPDLGIVANPDCPAGRNQMQNHARSGELTGKTCNCRLEAEIQISSSSEISSIGTISAPTLPGDVQRDELGNPGPLLN